MVTVPEENNLLIVLLAVVALCIALLIYILPTIIAFCRSHRNRWVILIINVVFGGTVLGWFFALIWAVNKLDDPLKGGTKLDRQGSDPII